MPGLCWFSAVKLFVFIKTLQVACVKFLIYAVCTEIFIYINWDTNLHPCCTLIGWFIVVSQGLLMKELGVFLLAWINFIFGCGRTCQGPCLSLPLLSAWMDIVSSYVACGSCALDRLACKLGTTWTSAQTQHVEWQRNAMGFPNCVQGGEMSIESFYPNK